MSEEPESKKPTTPTEPKASVEDGVAKGAQEPGTPPRSFRFSDKKYLLPFGRYVGATEVEPPADEVLVGREGQRAYLIDLLISSGRRGAYLVTGHRGAGKTSFVKYCISEYESSVFSRFLRGNVGRGVWDRVLVLLFWMSILIGALLATELVQFFVKSSQGGDENLLQWVILLPIGIILLYPCVYAKVALETCIRAAAKKADMIGSAPNPREVERDVGRWAGVVASIIVFVLLAAIWIAPYSGKPAEGISLLIPVIGALYAFVQAVSFRRQGKHGEVWPRVLFIFLAIALAGVLYESVAMSSIIASYVQGCKISEDEVPRYIFRGSLALGLIFLGLGSILRSWDQGERLGLVRSTRSNALKDAIAWGAWWYSFFGYVVFFGGSLLFNYILRYEALWVRALYFLLPALLLVGFFFKRENSQEGKQSQKETDEMGTTWFFQPRPTWILIAKAIISIVIALQLAYPVISVLSPESVLDFFRDRGLGFCKPTSLCGLSLVHENLFTGRTQEKFWLGALLIFIILFHIIEYEWIIRPYVRSREGQAFGAGGLAPWDEREPDTAPEWRRRALHSLAELTLPWQTYKAWLPVLPIAVNLGFDRLDHRRVIQTMLVGLRERYHRTFLAWNSSFANLGRFLGLLVLLVLTASIGRLIPKPQTPPLPAEDYKIAIGSSSFGGAENKQSGGKVAELGFPERVMLGLKGYAFLSVPAIPAEHLLLFDLLPYWPPQAREDKTLVTLVYIGVYHVLLFLLLFFFGHLLIHRMPLLPYKRNLNRIDDLLDSVSARTKVTSSLNLWGPARWVYSIFSDERIRETERDPVDPRTMELAFLQILDDVQKGGFRFPGAARHHLTMPAPEITFIFDELDKLGTRVEPQDGARDPDVPKQEIQVIHNERERSLKLRSLLSDLKNILTSAPARFVFVGGRDLHDEWLADQTARLPLLTSIFNTEVYLPSLLTDQPDPDTTVSPRERRREGRTRFLHERIEEYVANQYRRALLLYQRSVRKRWLPSLGLPAEALAAERFASVFDVVDSGTGRSMEKSAQEYRLELPDVLDASTGLPVDERERDFLLGNLVRFLTHRSMGNPKKLKDLLSVFLRPAGREFDTNRIRWSGTPFRHVIKLGDIEIFRIQLVVIIYRHLAHAFETRMVTRDDKYAISIFFLTDFLFKFHRRAFSWSNLERVDDLANIHRLPDLREIQEEIVNHFSERFLHRVTNGIYSFRFRSDVAREVEYLSRRSSAEMAALNFTLDESLSLKSEYLAAIEGSERNNPDLIAALGELYEFDQDFERARHQYRIAIEILDEGLVRIKGARKKSVAKALDDILNGKVDENSRLFLPWGVARLRLMLQIGMTFELERDLEQAEAEYRSARNLARTVVRVYVGATAQAPGNASLIQTVAGALGMGGAPKRPRRWEDRFHSIKHLNILFQPMFSEAWLAEKFVSSVDASVTLIERGLWEVRRTLPFVQKPNIQEALSPDQDPTTSHANFCLTMLQLHNKAGDLYFFKGRQPVTPSLIRELVYAAEDGRDLPTDGYLLRAHYNYAVSLHDLRRYIYYRIERSKVLSMAANKTPTLLAEALPDILLRAAAGSVNDMAEATLARISLFSLFKALRDQECESSCRDGRYQECLSWLAIDDEKTGESSLYNWFGVWNNDYKSEYTVDVGRLVDFSGPNRADQRLFMSLDFGRVGANLLAEGGYPENSGRELLQVCETVTRYLWWGRAVEWLSMISEQRGVCSNSCWREIGECTKEWKTMEEDKPGLRMTGIFLAHNFWKGLINLGIQVLERVDTLFRRSRYTREDGVRDINQAGCYLIGEIIPAEALTLLCSLRLGAMDVALDAQQRARLDSLAQRWVGPEHKNDKPGEEAIATLLMRSVQRHAYPMINRLKGMKVLIDHLVLKERISGKDSEREDEAEFQQALGWALELLDLNEQFDAPLHFTPSHSGMTCALVWLWGIQRFDVKKYWNDLDRIFRAAQRDLANSEEMYTMRRSYYEAISSLYYLYDDFNDRQIHYNHAIQMAGAELNALLKELVELANSSWRRPD